MLYEFADRIQGLLELADREAPKMVRDLEKRVRDALIPSRARTKRASTAKKRQRIAS